MIVVWEEGYLAVQCEGCNKVAGRYTPTQEDLPKLFRILEKAKERGWGYSLERNLYLCKGCHG